MCSQTCRRQSQKCRWHSQSCCWRSQICRRRSQICHRCFQACHQHSQVPPDTPNVVSSAPRCSETYHNHSHGTSVAVIRDPSYSEGLLVCPPMVCYSSEIDTFKFSLHILSDTPGCFRRLKYIWLILQKYRVRLLRLSPLVFAMGQGNLPAVRVWTRKTGRLGYRLVHSACIDRLND